MNIRLLRAGRFAGLCLALALVFGACDNPADGDDEDTAATTAAAAKAAQTAADTFFIAHSAILDKTADMLGLDDEAPAAAALQAYRGLSAEARALLAPEKAHLDSLLVQIEALKNAAGNGLYSRAADLGAWLAAQPENTPDDPYAVRYRGNELIRTLYDALAAADRYTALDLSLSGVKGFSAGTEEGRAFIVSLTLPDSLTETPDGTTSGPIFQEYTNLKTFSAAGLTRLGDYAFYSINIPTALTTVNLPKAETIGEYAFAYCSSLTTVNLPEAVTIGGSALRNCTVLTTISLPKAVTIGTSTFSTSGFTTISLPELVTVGSNAFAACGSLTRVTLPKAASIDNQAFRNCTNLQTVTIPAAVTIASAAFQGCVKLTTISLPKVETIGGSVFSGCTALTTITLGLIPPAIVPTAPSLPARIFTGVATTAKTITIKAPQLTLYTVSPWTDKMGPNSSPEYFWDNTAATRDNLTVALAPL